MTLGGRTFAGPAIAALLLLSGFRLCAAGDSEMDRLTLRGLEDVVVVVENTSVDAISDGLTVDQIQTDVELRLRKAGIKVRASSPSMLYVNVHLMKSKSPSDGLYVFSCVVAVEQAVVVSSNGVSALEHTWSVDGLGIVGRLNMSGAVRGDVGDLVDKFLNAYLSVNPK
jgi:hypothetical protein